MTKFEEEFNYLIELSGKVLIGQVDAEAFEKNRVAFFEKYETDQQQALPVVPECVAEFIESYKDRRTIYGVFDKISKNRKTYPKLYEWVFEDENSQATFALAFITGKYEVEKPQLFYLKNKLTRQYLYRRDKVSFGEQDYCKDSDDKPLAYCLFTKAEIDSMQTGSYEQIKAEEENEREKILCVS